MMRIGGHLLLLGILHFLYIGFEHVQASELPFKCNYNIMVAWTFDPMTEFNFSATADYLTRNLSPIIDEHHELPDCNITFRSFPYVSKDKNQMDLREQLLDGSVDFLITSAEFQPCASAVGTTALLSLPLDHLGRHARGVLLIRDDRKGIIRSHQDLAGKRVGVIGELSDSAFLLNVDQMAHYGLHPWTDLKMLALHNVDKVPVEYATYGATPDEVADVLRYLDEGKYDAVFASTDIQDLIDLQPHLTSRLLSVCNGVYKPLNETGYEMGCSENKRPNAVLLASQFTPDLVSTAVVKALLGLHRGHPALVQARMFYQVWEVPNDYLLNVRLAEQFGTLLEYEPGVIWCSADIPSNIVCPDGYHLKPRKSILEGCEVLGESCPDKEHQDSHIYPSVHHGCYCDPCWKKVDPVISLNKNRTQTCNSMQTCIEVVQFASESLSVILTDYSLIDSNVTYLVRPGSTFMGTGLIDDNASGCSDGKCLSVYDLLLPTESPGDYLVDLLLNGELISTSSVWYRVLPFSPVIAPRNISGRGYKTKCAKMSECSQVIQYSDAGFSVFFTGSPSMSKFHQQYNVTYFVKPGSFTGRGVLWDDGDECANNICTNIFDIFLPTKVHGDHLVEVLINGQPTQSSPLWYKVIPFVCENELEEPDGSGTCQCKRQAVVVNGRCVSAMDIVLGCLITVVALALAGFLLHCRIKKKQANRAWMIPADHLEFDEPLVVLGEGTFGWVVKGTYRGTSIAVKQILPPQQRRSSCTEPSLCSPVTSPIHGLCTVPENDDDAGRESTRDSSREDLWQDLQMNTSISHNPQVQDQSNTGQKPTPPFSSCMKSPSFNSDGSVYKETSKDKQTLGFKREDDPGYKDVKGMTFEFEHTPVLNLSSISKMFSERSDSSNLPTSCFGSGTSGHRFTTRKQLIFEVLSDIMDMNCLRSSKSRLESDFVREIRTVCNLRHPNIVTVMGAVVDKHQGHMLIMEHLELGSLYQILHNQTFVLEGSVCMNIMQDIVKGMLFLHEADPPVIHNDLKAANILIGADFKAKVSDFGFSQKRKLSVCRGTPEFMAPEVLRGQSSSTASDVYSFGILLVELFSRCEPYHGEDRNDVLRQIISYTAHPTAPEDAHPTAQAAPAELCSQEAEQRTPSHVKVKGLSGTAEKLAVQERDWEESAEWSKPKQEPQGPKRPKIPDECPAGVVRIMQECWHEDIEKRPSFRALDTVYLPLLDISSFSLGRMMRRNRQTEDVLFDVFPKHVAEKLMAGQKVEPEHKECVTVFFSDVVNFTTISSQIPPHKVSNLLNRMYNEFDRLAEMYKVHKVETIGDAYLAVTNLHAVEDYEHASNMAKFSLEIMEIIPTILIDEDDHSLGCIQIRIGLHSGPVVATLLGVQHPKYTLLGDTVNTSSRMESTSLPMKIQCSMATAKLIRLQDRRIKLKKRGKVHVKGKGEMITFWVEKTTLSDPIEDEDEASASSSRCMSQSASRKASSPCTSFSSRSIATDEHFSRSHLLGPLIMYQSDNQAEGSLSRGLTKLGSY